jgi:hypothetical protein
VLNTAVFGEVHVAQTDDSLREERGAVEFQNAVRRGVEGLLPAVSDRYAEYAALENGLDAAVANWTAVTQRQHARSAVATNASVNGVEFETDVVQNDSTNFTDRSNATSWTVANDTSNVSGYEMNVTDANLNQTSDCVDGGACFAVTVDGDTDNWKMFVHTTANATVAIEVNADGSTERCETTDSSVRIDLTNGTFDEGADECTFTAYGETADPPYTVTYTEANNVSGTYRLTAAGRLTAGSIADDDRYGTTGSPRLDPRIVAADVSVRYRSADLTYRTEIRVAPGERDG